MSAAGDRARGALYGLAIGDALGTPTQLMSHQEVAACLGVLDGFRAGPAGHPIASGLAAGSVTDDTEQALLLADTLLTGGGHIDSDDLARRLVAWAERAGNGDRWICWGRQAVRQWRRWWLVAQWTKHAGATNGAAMRITPVG